MTSHKSNKKSNQNELIAISFVKFADFI